MAGAGRRYGLLSETSGIEETRRPDLDRHLPPAAALEWLAAGWRDMRAKPELSLAYGGGVLLASALVIGTMFALGVGQVLFPALAGFMVVGPAAAAGLYVKSRAIERGEAVTFADMLRPGARSGGQILFVGVLLSLLMVLWMRAAVIVYALFFGYRPFPGYDHLAALLLGTPAGWAMLATGIAVGGLFAAFAFAISAFSIPMLLDERTDALTAMATSMALVWNNLPVAIAWGAVVVGLFLLSIATGLVALVVVFPLLGHATWHAWRALRPRGPGAPG